jgi:hypothetical protein
MLRIDNLAHAVGPAINNHQTVGTGPSKSV